MTTVGEAGQNFFPMFLQHLLQKIWFWPGSKSKRHRFLCSSTGQFSTSCMASINLVSHTTTDIRRGVTQFEPTGCTIATGEAVLMTDGLMLTVIACPCWAATIRSRGGRMMWSSKICACCIISQLKTYFYCLPVRASLLGALYDASQQLDFKKNMAQASAACWLISTIANPPSPPPRVFWCLMN